MIRKVILAIVTLVFSITMGAQAQYAIPASGGDGTGNGGSFSITVGQVFYTTSTATDGIISQGVQQTFPYAEELFTVSFHITDGENVIQNAQISINSTSISTDEAGNATINLETGNYPYSVIKEGYVDYTGSVTVNSANVDENVTLTTIAEEFTLTIAIVGEGNTTPEVGDHIYTEGTSVDLFASPSVGYQFAKWIIGDEEIFTQSVSFIITQDTLATAYFEETTAIQYTLTLTKVGNGTLTPPAGEHIFNEGAEVTITATPDDGWQFNGWSGDLDSENATEIITINSNLNIVANFSEIEHYNVLFRVTCGTRSPISDAVIFIEEIDEELITNSEGNANIDLQNGTYSFTVSKDGFETYSDSFTVNGEDVEVSVQIQTVGIEGNEIAEILAYPNPFSDYISLNNVSNVKRIVVTNLIGQIVKEVSLSGSYTETIYTNDLAKGVYLISFDSVYGERLVKKMIKY
ncbi:MAG TPA: PEGA domain-containing protein [Tenuifilaceae bacterium]|nr:PEGA domain-containing protein [Tenuifilaceae bacterium]